MSNKLFIGSLSYNTNQSDLEQIFSEFGSVQSVKIITDRESGRSRGFGFIEMESAVDAKAAISKVDGMSIDGRNVVVNIAADKPQSSSRDNQRSRAW